MEIMEGVHMHLLLLFVTLIQGIQGQVVTPLSVDVAVGDDVSLNCTTTATDSVSFIWTRVSTGVQIYVGGNKFAPQGEYGNFELDEDTTAKRSRLIIKDILMLDDGQYRCTVSGLAALDPATVEVEVGSLVPEEPDEPIELTSDGDNSNPTYHATCEAIGSSPAETITWVLDDVTQTDGIVETDPGISDDSLFDKRSVFTFPATSENFNVTLKCNIGGHQVDKLNRQETRRVDIHKQPQSGDIKIDFAGARAEFTVSCDDTNSAAIPAMSTFNIYSNGTLITKPVSDKAVIITEPEQDTEFTCEGINYLGNTTTSRTYDPDSTTTPPPVTALEKTTKSGDETGSGPRTGPTATQSSTPDNTGVTDPTSTEGPTPKPPIGPIIGGVVAAIVIIVIIVIAVCYCKTQERFCFEAGGTPAPSNKPSGRAVGSSNGSGSEKDVESPLNGVKDVTAEEKLPQAAPRGHGSIQHTNDNPDQAMYAMVDKKPARGGGGAGDAPDRGSGPGQNEPPGMLYADLDLSHKAGHTDKHVPKNENDVVVYSSILV